MTIVTDETKAFLRRFMEARVRRDELKKEHDEAKREYTDMELDLFEKLSESGLKGALKIDLGEPWGEIKFAPRETYYGRIIDEDEALAYYEGRSMIDEVSAPRFVMARINEDVRDAVEGNGDMPPGVDFYAQRGVTVTRQKS